MADRRAPRLGTATVTAVTDLGGEMRRLTLEGDDLAVLGSCAFPDAYLKVVLCRGGQTLLRTYTARAFGPGRCYLDVLLHPPAAGAPTGPGTAWASAARVGDVVRWRGPGGKYAVPECARHVLVGDRAALPAFENLVEQVGPGVRVDAVVVTEGCSRPLSTPAGVRWIECADAGEGLAAVAALDLTTEVAGFVHGEAGFCRDVRRFLRVERGIDPEASAYWMRGVDDEGWRAVKSGWKAPVDDVEAAALARLRA